MSGHNIFMLRKQAQDGCDDSPCAECPMRARCFRCGLACRRYYTYLMQEQPLWLLQYDGQVPHAEIYDRIFE